MESTLKCPKCGGDHIEKVTKRTPTGRNLMWGGAALTLLAGIGLPIAVVGYCLKDEKNKCQTCGWTWKG